MENIYAALELIHRLRAARAQLEQDHNFCIDVSDCLLPFQEAPHSDHNGSSAPILPSTTHPPRDKSSFSNVHNIYPSARDPRAALATTDGPSSVTARASIAAELEQAWAGVNIPAPDPCLPWTNPSLRVNPDLPSQDTNVSYGGHL